MLLLPALALMLALMLVLVLTPGCNADDRWDEVTKVLQSGVADHAFPGAVALVVNETDVLYSKAVGSFTYGNPPPFSTGNPAMTMASRFDLASLTKVLSTTTATMTFYQRGELNLNELVAAPQLLGPSYAQNGKGPIKVINLLLHNAGWVLLVTEKAGPCVCVCVCVCVCMLNGRRGGGRSAG